MPVVWPIGTGFRPGTSARKFDVPAAPRSESWGRRRRTDRRSGRAGATGPVQAPRESSHRRISLRRGLDLNLREQRANGRPRARDRHRHDVNRHEPHRLGSKANPTRRPACLPGFMRPRGRRLVSRSPSRSPSLCALRSNSRSAPSGRGLGRPSRSTDKIRTTDTSRIPLSRPPRSPERSTPYGGRPPRGSLSLPQQRRRSPALQRSSRLRS